MRKSNGGQNPCIDIVMVFYNNCLKGLVCMLALTSPQIRAYIVFSAIGLCGEPLFWESFWESFFFSRQSEVRVPLINTPEVDNVVVGKGLTNPTLGLTLPRPRMLIPGSQNSTNFRKLRTPKLRCDLLPSFQPRASTTTSTSKNIWPKQFSMRVFFWRVATFPSRCNLTKSLSAAGTSGSTLGGSCRESEDALDIASSG